MKVILWRSKILVKLSRLRLKHTSVHVMDWKPCHNWSLMMSCVKSFKCILRQWWKINQLIFIEDCWSTLQEIFSGFETFFCFFVTTFISRKISFFLQFESPQENRGWSKLQQVEHFPLAYNWHSQFSFKTQKRSGAGSIWSLFPRENLFSFWC